MLSGPAPAWTHFLALQVSHSPVVQQAYQQVQSALLAHDPGLQPAFEPAVKAHLTLMMLDLGPVGTQQREAKLSEAHVCMQTLGAALKSKGLLKPLHLTLAGLGSFGDQVLFLKLNSGAVDTSKGALQTADVIQGEAAPATQVLQGAQQPPSVTPRTQPPLLNPQSSGPHTPQPPLLAAQPSGPSSHLHELAALTRDVFMAAHPGSACQSAFVPHVTIAKVSTMIRKRKRDPAAAADMQLPVKQRHVEQQLQQATAEQGSQGTQQQAQEEQGGGEGQGVGPTTPPAQQLQEQLTGSFQAAPPQAQGCIPPAAYAHVTGLDCGELEVDAVQICEMAKRLPGSYYNVVETLSLEELKDNSLSVDVGGKGS